jgi:hypothetical protein
MANDRDRITTSVVEARPAIFSVHRSEATLANAAAALPDRVADGGRWSSGTRRHTALNPRGHGKCRSTRPLSAPHALLVWSPFHRLALMLPRDRLPSRSSDERREPTSLPPTSSSPDNHSLREGWMKVPGEGRQRRFSQVGRPGKLLPPPDDDVAYDGK